MEFWTERDADWIKWIAPGRFNDEEFFRIVTFFVFHSPCENLSSMRKSLSEYGWETPWRNPYYLNKQLKQAATNPSLLFSASKYEVMEETLEKADLKDSFPSDFHVERICIYDVKENQFMSVFYHIRNSLAHGRLNMIDIDGECVFILEDITGRRKDRVKVSARMILRKNTLLRWIEIIENGQREYQEK